MHKISELIDKQLNVNKITKKNNVNNVKAQAYRLVEKLNDPKSYKFFLKVSWHLPESKIENNLESALKGRNPRRLFTWLCIKDLRK